MHDKKTKHSEEPLGGKPHPQDRFKIVYVIFFLSGVGTLLPWNFFITAIPYFQYKMRNVSLGDNAAIDPSLMTNEQVLFANYLTLCSMLPRTIFNILNLFLVKCISSFTLYVTGSTFTLLMFGVTVAVVRIDLDTGIFLTITLVSVVIINVGNALVQGGLFGIASCLPARNMKAYMEGQAVAGVVAAVANIVTVGASKSPIRSALAYFVLALAFLGLTTCLTLTLKKNAYFCYYWNAENALRMQTAKSSQSSEEPTALDPLTSRATRDRFTFFRSMREVALPGLTVGFVLLVTLSLFPPLLQSVRSSVYPSSNRWASTFFSPVVVFLLFSVCDYLGRLLAGVIKWPRRTQPNLMLVLTVSRVLLIPFALFMNQQPRQHLPVLFAHDTFPILFVILLGLTNGYFVSLEMMYGPSTDTVDQIYQNTNWKHLFGCGLGLALYHSMLSNVSRSHFKQLKLTSTTSRFASPGNSEGAGVALSLYLVLGMVSGVTISAWLITLI